jgi:NitT/TauT family transport system substrate-binding protein
MQRKLLQKIGLPAMAMIIILVLAGCARDDQKPLEEVSYRLKWLFNISVVGDLYTHDSGLFAKNGLNVTVKPGGPEKDAIKELELGHAQFGVASADQVIRAVSKGAPICIGFIGRIKHRSKRRGI